MRRERGAALLVFMLIIVVGAAYVLVSRLNANVRLYKRQTASIEALSEAKAALISYAVSYPEHKPGEGPGYLPCPDRTDPTDTAQAAFVGRAGTGCSFSGTNTNIGRFPFKTLEFDDLHDYAGERLWYAVSENYKNSPKALPFLNSETSGTLTVDGYSDIVAVIIAPGEVVGSQARGGSAAVLDAANYLEDDNADGDGIYVSRASGDFNDQLVFITRRELMAAVEQRVINQVRTVLGNYYATYGAYPWLTSFGDPKAAFRILRGSHKGASSSITLDDSTEDFNDWGVQSGDTVINITDGSMGTVSAVSASGDTLSVGSLVMGTDNDFDDGDEYAVITRSNGGLMSGTADTGTGSLTLADSGKDFEELGVSAGDIIDNITDGSSGMVETVSLTQLTVESLTGGSSNTFSVGDNYRIRSNRGTATGGSGGLVLEDTGQDFSNMGLSAGDLVVNLSDGSYGLISSVSTTTLTVDSLQYGTNNSFTSGDYYYIPRFNTNHAARYGLLSYHEPGKDFSTGFDMDWDIRQANGATYAWSSTATYLQSKYTTALQDYTETSGGTSGTLSISRDDGSCTWAIENIADCRGSHSGAYMEGTVTTGTNTHYLTDSNADFVTAGVNLGDIVENYDDEENGVNGTAGPGSSGTTLVDTVINFNNYTPYNYLINNVTQASALGVAKVEGVITRIVDGNTLEVSSYPGGTAIQFSPGDSYTIYQPDRTVVAYFYSPTQLYTNQLSSNPPDLDTGEYYRIKAAASSFWGLATDQCCGHSAFRATGVDFAGRGVKVGDIVRNATDNSYGVITSIAGDWIYMSSGMYDYYGWNEHWDKDDYYVVYYNYVNRREYELRPRISGNQSSPIPDSVRVYGSGKIRKRDVCLGYEDVSGNPDCSTTATAQSAALPPNGSTPVVTIGDYDDSGAVVASAAVTVPASGTATGSTRVSGLDYYLQEADDELPGWFLKNHWDRLLYVAYGSGYSPDGSGSCTPGTDCLEIQGRLATDDRQGVVLSAGTELGNVTCPDLTAQNRARGRLCDYFEDENATDGDDIFRKDRTSTFNDRIISVNP